MKRLELTEKLLKNALMLMAGAVLLLAGVSASAKGDADKGKEISGACAACHGADGNSENPTFPILAGQYASYIVKALEDYKSGQRKNAIMAGFAASLTQEAREDLGAFYASQKSKLTVLSYTK